MANGRKIAAPPTDRMAHVLPRDRSAARYGRDAVRLGDGDRKSVAAGAFQSDRQTQRLTVTLLAAPTTATHSEGPSSPLSRYRGPGTMDRNRRSVTASLLRPVITLN
ncbi:hypothetical protein SKAU_G00269940 [Synaphobranchus kaupii]|uniref:Uncharacterized protein n=1 Tax=Synaphobranchus kaupii TaxID=118154 RepID=A0A9Q1IPK2_SYNKA|nr:hypothetical protein SKAU_G00269940 [Synaphobranchus kaupii]